MNDSQLSVSTGEIQEKQDKVKYLQDRVSNQEEKINSYITKIGQLEASAATQQGVVTQEIEGILCAFICEYVCR